ncbi:recombinase [Pandoraea pneumonica]|jgi:predicted nucleic acid-binding protein|uniref:Ribonuclease VapC n=1 Tax=Pandoraea pneumonica TaxID=2508299 RepID=A0A5E4UYD8_9BURK|nr:type II toxin-antitoxin system VapC family toxin [Pandoraea pneumonica]VVE03550.1 recombinase [Pandoraea pneumonica]
MYLVDTNVVSELRKRGRSDPGVAAFIQYTMERSLPRYLSVISIGEMRRGAASLRCRGDAPQAVLVENWLESILYDYRGFVLPVTEEIGHTWGRLRAKHKEHAIDKLIAATALVHRLVVVTRNVKDFSDTGVEVHNPFLH